jgi:hypothetical protein
MALLTSCSVALVCSPDGPGTPFGTPLIALFDTIRVVCVLAALATIGFTLPAYPKMSSGGQRARMVALLLFTLQAITTESEHIGDYASLRLGFNLAAVLYGLYGIWQLRREEPAQRRTERR